ncbi:MAG: alpha/beta fold hydrolase [Gaiellaceae bacterium]
MTGGGAAASAMRRRDVTVGGSRQVHYRRAGAGPALVLMHESPLSSAALVDLASALSERFTVIALDTPGYGSSDPLPAPSEPETSDYAAAAADTLGALGVERCLVYGALTGATIALELARSRPDLVAGAALDFLPWFPPEQRPWFLENYLPLFPTRSDGSHLVTLWARFRDQYAYLPWCDRRLEHRMDIDMPSTQELDQGVMDMLRAGDGYRVAYAAAFRYEPEPALADLAAPAALVAPSAEIGHEQSELLSADPVSLTTAPLPGGAVAADAIRGLADAVGDLPSGPSDVGAWERDGTRTTRSYVDTTSGQLHACGRLGTDSRPLVMLHPSPGSSRMLDALLGQLIESRPVVAFDTLGNGESDKPPGWERPKTYGPAGPAAPIENTRLEAPWAEPSIADYAAVVAEAIERLGIDEFDLYGSHTGGAIAVETAIALGPDRARSVIVDGLAMFTAEERDEHLEHYTPPLEPSWDGAHLVWAWSYLQAQLRYWPWYDQSQAGIRWTHEASSDELHAWVIELLKSGHTYPLAYRAAFSYPMVERLPLLASRTLIGAVDDDPLAECSEPGARLAPNATAVVFPAGLSEKAALLASFLDDSRGESE